VRAGRVIGCSRCAKPCALVGDEIPDDLTAAAIMLCPWCLAALRPAAFSAWAFEQARQMVDVKRLEDALTLETRVSLDFQKQRDDALSNLDTLRVELLEVQHEIGEAWFAGGVDTPAALRRKTAALERLGTQPMRCTRGCVRWGNDAR